MMNTSKSINVTREMIEVGTELLAAWHYHGEDAYVSIEKIVKEIYEAMADAAISPSQKSEGSPSAQKSSWQCFGSS